MSVACLVAGQAFLGEGVAAGTWAADTWAGGTLHLQPGSRKSRIVTLRSLSAR